jgi:hypothetical protein
MQFSVVNIGQPGGLSPHSTNGISDCETTLFAAIIATPVGYTTVVLAARPNSTRRGTTLLLGLSLQNNYPNNKHLLDEALFFEKPASYLTPPVRKCRNDESLTRSHFITVLAICRTWIICGAMKYVV